LKDYLTKVTEMENETKYVSESEKNSEDAKCYGTLPIKVLLSEKPKGPY
jgi:hypothetical protein